MASADIVQGLIDYYTNLLIIQYNNQPSAEAEVALLAETLLANGILFDIQNGFNIVEGNGPLAEGVQLDIIGKYVGLDRYFAEITLEDYFSLITYAEVASPPTSPPRFGFETYATFGEQNYSGTLIYPDIIGTENALTDANFLTLIKLAIIINNSNFSMQSIDQELFNFFGTGIRAESYGNMSMAFFVDYTIAPLVEAILFKKLLPVPMAVGAAVVTDISSNIFALCDYTGYQSPYGYGFSDYADYATLPGDTLNYGQLMQG